MAVATRSNSVGSPPHGLVDSDSSMRCPSPEPPTLYFSTAAAVSRIPYTTMPCENIRMQIDQEISNLETLSGEQIASRNWDIALNLILIPGVGALTGDQEDAIAQSKGKMVVMQDEYANRCSQG